MPVLRKSLVPLIVILLHLNQIESQLVRKCPPQEDILPCRCLQREHEIQVWCSHSNLPKVMEGLKAIGKYFQDPIDELILENNHLPSLPGKTFAALRVMRIMLRYNGLERVSTGWLSGLETSLVELFLVEPQLRSLPEDSVERMIALEAITIQSDLMKRLPKFSGLPKLRYLQIESSSLVEMSPRHFRALRSLEKLHVGGSSRLSRLEGGMLQDLPKLTLVNISFCGITWIHPRSITHLPALTELWLVGNKITDAAIVGRSIRDLPALEDLHLDDNYIDNLNEAAFVDIPSLKKLFLSNNKITEIHHGAFHRVQKLKVLDLNKNMVRRVHPESFLQHSGSGLEELWLVENEISHVAELRSILDALPSLIFLDMSNNNLEAIPFGALRGHATLERLHLDNNKIHMIDREAFMAMPALRELRLRNNSLSDVLLGPLWNLPALKGLDLSQNYFRRLEPQLLANLPSLRKVDLSENEVTFINPDLFMSCPSLEHVNISYNHLATLHPATFRNLLGLYELDVSSNRLLEFVPGLPRGLEYLYMAKNEITSLPSHTSSDLNLPSLRLLDLNRNKIQMITPGGLKSLPKLKKLYLGNNLLQQLEDGSLSGLPSLEVLDLKENRILQVYPDAIQESTELREISIGNNRLNVIRPELFYTTPYLKKLDISGNQLTEISSDALQKIRDVQIIDASDNALVYLPTNLHGLKHLRILDLTDNHIKIINTETLRSLNSLTELRISRNFITELRKGSFDNLMHLKSIHLDKNELETLEPYTFNYLPSLRTVKMNENKLQEIPNNAFNNLPALQVLELQNNRLKKISNNAFYEIPHLLMLNLSYNHLQGLEDAGLKTLRSLEMLDLTNNRITQISNGNLAKMEWLVELRLNDNFICSVHGSPFNGMPRLRVLSMKNNRMVSFPEQAVQKLRGNLDFLDIDGNPLMCSCNMLWFRAWLQESSAIGPKCTDGGLLRDVRLSRQECLQESRLPEPVVPGCEAELLSAPDSQVLTPWQNLKQNSSSLSMETNKLAPLPEESDYFYDEYVDYPYNETIMSSSMLNNRNKSEDVNLNPNTSIHNSAHYIPGDTPTIYAAPSKNNSKVAVEPSIPKVPSSSPSNSGFTFFGVPLPNLNLNLNNLWTRGNGRMSIEKNIKDEQVAERKNAIVNNIPSTIMHSNRLHKLPPLLPTIPDIQTGGFFPLIPESGGFKPIADPSSQISISSIEKLNVTELFPSADGEINEKFLDQLTNDNILKSESIVEHLTQSVQNYVAPTEVANMTKPKIDSMPTLSSFPKTEQKVSTEPSVLKRSDLYNKPNSTTKLEIPANLPEKSKPSPPAVQQKLSTINESTTVYIPENISYHTEQPLLAVKTQKNNTYSIEVSKEIEHFDEEFTEFPESVSISSTSSTVAPFTTSTTLKPKSTTTIVSTSSSTIRSNIKVEQMYTPLSALLVPGGGSQLKSHGKSIITRVPSPHILEHEPIDLQDSPKDKPLSLTHIREEKQVANFDDIVTTQVINTRNQDISWYYINYNKTNLEPYIGPGGPYPKNGVILTIKADVIFIFSILIFTKCTTIAYST